MTTRNRRRHDLIVVERPNGQLVPVARSEFYRRPKPKQAIALIQPQSATVLPPEKPLLRVSVTHTRWSNSPEPYHNSYYDFLAAALRFCSRNR